LIFGTASTYRPVALSPLTTLNPSGPSVAMTSASFVPFGNVAMSVPWSYPDSSCSFSVSVVVRGRGDADAFASSLSLSDGVEFDDAVGSAARGKGTPMTTTYAAINAEINQPAPSGARGDATRS